MFALVYDAEGGKGVMAVNGSGRCAQGVDLGYVLDWLGNVSGGVGGADAKVKAKEVFMASVHAATVPGAAAGWEDMWEKYGSKRFEFAELLEPAAKLAEEGFPVAPVTAQYWHGAFYQLARWMEDVKDVELSVPVAEVRVEVK